MQRLRGRFATQSAPGGGSAFDYIAYSKACARSQRGSGSVPEHLGGAGVSDILEFNGLRLASLGFWPPIMPQAVVGTRQLDFCAARRMYRRDQSRGEPGERTKKW